MENTRVKKIVILVAALLALTIVGLQFGLTNFMQAFAEPNQDVKVEYSAQVNEEKSEAQVQINATPKEQDVEITSIELPNGEVVNDTAATYTTTENGKLTFAINYKLPKVSSEEPFIEKEPEYEEKQQTTVYQVTGIQYITEQEDQTPTQSNPGSTTEGNLESAPETNSSSTSENNTNSTPETTPNSPPALQQPPLTNGALQQNNLGDTPNAYTPESAFSFNPDTGAIFGYNESIGGTDVVIPPTINGIPVKTIWENTFELTSITSVILPEGLQTIQDDAFSTDTLAGELKLPASLQTIGDFAFSNTSLTSLTIAGVTDGTSQLQTIGKFAFQNAQLAGDLKLPASLQTIGLSAFLGSPNGSTNHLTSVTIAGIDNATSQLQSIGNSAFKYNKLTGELKLPASLQTIGNEAFLGYSKVSTNQLTSVIIADSTDTPSQLKSIGSAAFQSNQLAGELKLPASLQTIGGSAFSSDSYGGPTNHLTSVTIAGATDGTSQLQSIAYSAFAKNQLTGELKLPASLQTIGNSAFQGYSNGSTNRLTNVTIAGVDNATSQLQSIGDYAFENNQLAGELKLPASLQTIGNSAFQGSSSDGTPTNQITIVTIAGIDNNSSQLKRIGYSVFKDNKLAGELKLPASLETIGSYAFGNEANKTTPTNQLTGVTIKGTTDSTSQLQGIGQYAFNNNKLTGELKLPSSLQSISSYAFQGQNNGSTNRLTSVTIVDTAESPTQLRDIGDYTFANNQLAGELKLPASLETIGRYAFYNNQLSSVTIADTTDRPIQLQNLLDDAFASSAAGFNQIIYINIPNNDNYIYLGNKLLDGNTISGKYCNHDSGTTNYQINLHDQIPGFNPANYKVPTVWSGDSPFVHVTDYSYDNQTGIFTFSSDDIRQAQLGLMVTNIGNNSYQEGGGQEENRSIILFNNLQPYSNVTLNLQGGQFTDSSFNGVLSVLPNTAIGHEIGANDIKFPGFDFLGWYTDTACTQPFDMMTDIVTNDMTLYAKWQWNGTQNPSVLVEIPSKIELSEYPAEQMAKGNITLSVVNSPFTPNRNIIIKTNPNLRLTNPNRTDFYQISIFKPNNTPYTDPNDALLTLNNFGNGHPQSDTFSVQTPIDDIKLFGTYKGNITYDITLE